MSHEIPIYYNNNIIHNLDALADQGGSPSPSPSEHDMGASCASSPRSVDTSASSSYFTSSVSSIGSVELHNMDGIRPTALRRSGAVGRARSRHGRHHRPRREHSQHSEGSVHSSGGDESRRRRGLGSRTPLLTRLRSHNSSGAFNLLDRGRGEECETANRFRAAPAVVAELASLSSGAKIDQAPVVQLACIWSSPSKETSEGLSSAVSGTSTVRSVPSGTIADEMMCGISDLDPGALLGALSCATAAAGCPAVRDEGSADVPLSGRTPQCSESELYPSSNVDVFGGGAFGSLFEVLPEEVTAPFSYGGRRCIPNPFKGRKGQGKLLPMAERMEELRELQRLMAVVTECSRTEEASRDAIRSAENTAFALVSKMRISLGCLPAPCLAVGDGDDSVASRTDSACSGAGPLGVGVVLPLVSNLLPETSKTQGNPQRKKKENPLLLFYRNDLDEEDDGNEMKGSASVAFNPSPPKSKRRRIVDYVYSNKVYEDALRPENPQWLGHHNGGCFTRYIGGRNSFAGASNAGNAVVGMSMSVVGEGEGILSLQPGMAGSPLGLLRAKKKAAMAGTGVIDDASSGFRVAELVTTSGSLASTAVANPKAHDSSAVGDSVSSPSHLTLRQPTAGASSLSPSQQFVMASAQNSEQDLAAQSICRNSSFFAGSMSMTNAPVISLLRPFPPRISAVPSICCWPTLDGDVALSVSGEQVPFSGFGAFGVDSSGVTERSALEDSRRAGGSLGEAHAENPCLGITLLTPEVDSLRGAHIYVMGPYQSNTLPPPAVPAPEVTDLYPDARSSELSPGFASLSMGIPCASRDGGYFSAKGSRGPSPAFGSGIVRTMSQTPPPTSHAPMARLEGSSRERPGTASSHGIAGRSACNGDGLLIRSEHRTSAKVSFFTQVVVVTSAAAADILTRTAPSPEATRPMRMGSVTPQPPPLQETLPTADVELLLSTEPDRQADVCIVPSLIETEERSSRLVPSAPPTLAPLRGTFGGLGRLRPSGLIAPNSSAAQSLSPHLNEMGTPLLNRAPSQPLTLPVASPTIVPSPIPRQDDLGPVRGASGNNNNMHSNRYPIVSPGVLPTLRRGGGSAPLGPSTCPNASADATMIPLHAEGAVVASTYAGSGEVTSSMLAATGIAHLSSFTPFLSLFGLQVGPTLRLMLIDRLLAQHAREEDADCAFQALLSTDAVSPPLLCPSAPRDDANAGARRLTMLPSTPMFVQQEDCFGEEGACPQTVDGQVPFDIDFPPKHPSTIALVSPSNSASCGGNCSSNPTSGHLGSLFSSSNFPQQASPFQRQVTGSCADLGTAPASNIANPPVPSLSSTAVRLVSLSSMVTLGHSAVGLSAVALGGGSMGSLTGNNKSHTKHKDIHPILANLLAQISLDKEQDAREERVAALARQALPREEHSGAGASSISRCPSAATVQGEMVDTGDAAYCSVDVGGSVLGESRRLVSDLGGFSSFGRWEHSVASGFAASATSGELRSPSNVLGGNVAFVPPKSGSVSDSNPLAERRTSALVGSDASSLRISAFAGEGSFISCDGEGEITPCATPSFHRQVSEPMTPDRIAKIAKRTVRLRKKRLDRRAREVADNSEGLGTSILRDPTNASRTPSEAPHHQSGGSSPVTGRGSNDDSGRSSRVPLAEMGNGSFGMSRHNTSFSPMNTTNNLSGLLGLMGSPSRREQDPVSGLQSSSRDAILTRYESNSTSQPSQRLFSIAAPCSTPSIPHLAPSSGTMASGGSLESVHVDPSHFLPDEGVFRVGDPLPLKGAHVTAVASGTTIAHSPPVPIIPPHLQLGASPVGTSRRNRKGSVVFHDSPAVGAHALPSDGAATADDGMLAAIVLVPSGGGRSPAGRSPPSSRFRREVIRTPQPDIVRPHPFADPSPMVQDALVGIPLYAPPLSGGHLAQLAKPRTHANVVFDDDLRECVCAYEEVVTHDVLHGSTIPRVRLAEAPASCSSSTRLGAHSNECGVNGALPFHPPSGAEGRLGPSWNTEECDVLTNDLKGARGEGTATYGYSIRRGYYLRTGRALSAAMTAQLVRRVGTATIDASTGATIGVSWDSADCSGDGFPIGIKEGSPGVSAGMTSTGDRLQFSSADSTTNTCKYLRSPGNSHLSAMQPPTLFDLASDDPINMSTASTAVPNETGNGPIALDVDGFSPMGELDFALGDFPVDLVVPKACSDVPPRALGSSPNITDSNLGRDTYFAQKSFCPSGCSMPMVPGNEGEALGTSFVTATHYVPAEDRPGRPHTREQSAISVISGTSLARIGSGVVHHWAAPSAALANSPRSLKSLPTAAFVDYGLGLHLGGTVAPALSVHPLGAIPRLSHSPSGAESHPLEGSPTDEGLGNGLKSEPGSRLGPFTLPVPTGLPSLTGGHQPLYRSRVLFEATGGMGGVSHGSHLGGSSVSDASAFLQK